MNSVLSQTAREVSATLQKLGFTVPWELILQFIMDLLVKRFNSTSERFFEVAKNPGPRDIARLERCCRVVARRAGVPWRERSTVAIEMAEAILESAELADQEALKAVREEALQ